MLTRSKRKRELNTDETLQPVKVAKPSPLGIPSEQLAQLFYQYKKFLTDKQRRGTGPLTHLESRQKTRSEQVAALEDIFANIKEQQTFENWQTLLIRLVEYRIAVYSENHLMPKSESTFGNALWAVQEHILQTLEKAYSTNLDCVMLNKLIDYKNNPHTLTAETEEETKILKAAFGSYTVLKKSYPALGVVTETVKRFITEIDQPSAEESLTTESLYSSIGSSIALFGNQVVENPLIHPSKLNSAI
jgi:predicted ATP-binding protein involved in virulence